MTRIRIVAVVGLLFLVWAGGAHASDKIPIGLDVQFDNQDIQAEATSYLSRELRSLGDVELVTSGAQLVIHVLGAGDDTLAISTVVERAYHGEWFQKFGVELALSRNHVIKEGAELTPDTWSVAKRFIGESDILGQWVNLTTRRTLKDACVGLVAHIDTSAISKQREWLTAPKKSDTKAVPPN